MTASIMRNVIELLINPFCVCLFLLGLCALLFWRQTHTVFAQITILVVFIVLLVISTGWLPNLLVRSLETPYQAVTAVDPGIKWIVVLGGGQMQVKGYSANLLLTSASIKRLVEGVRLFRALPNAKLLLMGGGSIKKGSEAFHMGELASWFDIPTDRVVLETESINTADQARALKSLVKNEKFYLVTSAMHMPRSIALCKQQHLNPIPAPTDYMYLAGEEGLVKKLIPNAYNLFYFNMAMHEWLGRVWMYKPEIA